VVSSIEEGNGRRPTMRDIARLAGVSVATVSRVINNRAGVAPETRDAVLEQLRAHHFTTNRGARGLSLGRTGFVGFTMPFIRADYFASILAGAVEAAYERDMRVALCATHSEHDREVSLLEQLMDGATDGAIILLPEETSDELDRLRARRYPFVVADPRLSLPPGIPAVSAAHRAGAKAATDHLLELGHRRIAHVSGPRGWVATEERIEGFNAALAAAGVLPSPELVLEGDFESPSGYAAGRALLDLRAPPTAVFASNDNMAFGALQAARERGLSVPDDLSVVGFDDADLATIVSPALTTVRQPLAELGRTSVSLLMRLIEGRRFEGLRVELAGRLVVRESTGPPRLR
jgi:LacI family transcriptional regulator